MHQRVLVAAAAALASLAFAVPALAFDCTVARKPPLAGAVAVIDVTTEPEQITFLEPTRAPRSTRTAASSPSPRTA